MRLEISPTDNPIARGLLQIVAVRVQLFAQLSEFLHYWKRPSFLELLPES
jgi:hypothetical protein